jgi:hypothetical protein
MEALIASMSALGDEEKRPPHMVLAPGFLASSDTLFHPGLRLRSLCHSQLGTPSGIHPARGLISLRNVCQFKTS